MDVVIPRKPWMATSAGQKHGRRTPRNAARMSLLWLCGVMTGMATSAKLQQNSRLMTEEKCRNFVLETCNYSAMDLFVLVWKE